MSITRQARTLYSDFVEYKELDREPLTSIHPGILVAFDSTALASLYNYPTHVSDEILRAYSQLRGHAFLPHQALKEFWAALDGASPVPAAADRVRSALASFKETLPEERNSPWSALRSVTHQLDHSIAACHVDGSGVGSGFEDFHDLRDGVVQLVRDGTQRAPGGVAFFGQGFFEGCER